jgi:hypothetical protein
LQKHPGESRSPSPAKHSPIIEQIAQANRTALADEAYRQLLIEDTFERNPA